MSALDSFIAAYRAATGNEPRGDRQKTARCPAHEDSTASLSISEGRDGRVIVHCHAGCSLDAICCALGIMPSDLFQKETRSAGSGTRDLEVATYDYTDEHGALLYQVVRFEPKRFLQRKPDGKGGWDWSTAGVRRVLYRLPELLDALEKRQPIYVVEGEKDADALWKEGYPATCNAGGAGKWLEGYGETLAGANVTVIADNDDPGKAHAAAVATSLRSYKARVTVSVPARGKDVSEHLYTYGLPFDELVELDGGPKPDPTVDEFLAELEPEHDWLVPDLLERGERLIVTGPEGGGKSTLLRQMALQVSCGIHPFTGMAIEPKSVFLIDLENTSRHVRAKLRDMRSLLPPDRLLNARIRVHTQGLDLLRAIDQAWLEERIIVNEPDLICMGPLYKLAAGDPNEEQGARTVALFLDALRVRYGFTLILEGHSPHAVAGGRRPERPYGASLWMRWPEFGIYLSEQGVIRNWRGPRDTRAWPEALGRGQIRNGEWPWTQVTSPRDLTFAEILDAVKTAGKHLSLRELEELLGTPKSNIDRAIKANQKQWTETLEGFKK